MLTKKTWERQKWWLNDPYFLLKKITSQKLMRWTWNFPVMCCFDDCECLLTKGLHVFIVSFKLSLKAIDDAVLLLWSRKSNCLAFKCSYWVELDGLNIRRWYFWLFFSKMGEFKCFCMFRALDLSFLGLKRCIFSEWLLIC